MKARIKKTGEIKSFYPTTQSGYDGYVDEDGKWYYPKELDFTLSDPGEEVTIEGYVARDDGERWHERGLHLFTNKPERRILMGDWIGRPSMTLDSSLFPDLKWTDLPLEVTITIKPKKK